MKDKLEEKIQYIKDAGYDLTDYETVDMLCSFIKESNREAVEDFTNYLKSQTLDIGVENYRYFIEGFINGRYEEYLSSIGKEER